MGGMSSLSTGVFELSLDAGGSCANFVHDFDENPCAPPAVPAAQNENLGPADPPGLLRVLFAAVQGIVAVQGKQALSVPESYALVCILFAYLVSKNAKGPEWLSGVLCSSIRGQIY
ncbi:hypothetical protein GLAREA_06432 [Glarea lozoyensis ATCC 20868]|uniref:Uncharacterized protein n=1 Tax=Glarea lozoyensis (strain ATCC 20868 / MF5171) TaxID=1116229 RepID=S3D8E8_GLAL2|nr:uncharacterized protein GLAREA_06432 [Glarea lozoyensis ATCC 20868]EPE33419.1 hypothetical protein GLAREA_06432 [Glarea lozoyensis ATCC 20868]